MSLQVVFDTPSSTASVLLPVTGWGVVFDGTSELVPGSTVGSVIEATIYGGPPGPAGPAGVVVIASTEEFPPPGTPVGTITYKRVV